eukprot:3337804-Prymnesium_polylepis.2
MTSAQDQEDCTGIHRQHGKGSVQYGFRGYGAECCTARASSPKTKCLANMQNHRLAPDPHGRATRPWTRDTHSECGHVSSRATLEF